MLPDEIWKFCQNTGNVKRIKAMTSRICKLNSTLILKILCYLCGTSLCYLCGSTTAFSQGLNDEPTGRIQFNAQQGAMPIARVGGGIRGTEGSDIVFTVIAPPQTGLTTQAQPTLYWYQSEPAEDMEFEFTLNFNDETIHEIRLGQAINTGIQKLDLSESEVSLEANQPYEWIIALIPDPNDRAKDITSSTFIQRIAVTETLSNELQNADSGEHPYIYANAGIWYDALKSLNDAIEAAPDDEKLKLTMMQLLEQADLAEIVQLEKHPISVDD